MQKFVGYILSFLMSLFFMLLGISTGQCQPGIKSMEWGSNLKINLQLTNDSSYTLNIDTLHHTDQTVGRRAKKYTHYPARLSEEFITQLEQIEIDSFNVSDNKTSTVDASGVTLWSSLHHLIGGEWAHFTNTILYALEKNYLQLKAPLMKRPETNWRPSPMTESYKRTRKWAYYVPVDQRLAQKEYKIQKKNDELGALKDVPNEFIELFLETNNREYGRMKERNEKDKIAKIDLVKLLIGAKYLSTVQIDYIKTMVMKAINEHSKKELPSIIIFNNFNAAVAMSLNENGYKAEKITFNDKNISETQRQEREKAIRTIVDNINKTNKELFKKRLESYYTD
ncbi:MAG: hypothetical protein ACLFNJ_09690 [Bacteroidales bacterium]